MSLTAQHIEGFVNALLKKNFDSPAEIPTCHLEWWDMCCSKHKFVALSAPRGHAKSTAITLAYTMANLLFRERQFILLVSDTEAQSSLFLNTIKSTLLNDDIKTHFHVKSLIKDTETDFIVEFEDGHQARVLAKGSEQKLRGINWDNKRPDLIVCDDMENDEIVLNKERREKFRRWFSGALLPCRSKDGIIRFIGTILHMDSMLERLMPREWDKKNIITDLSIKCPEDVSGWYSAKYKAHTPDFKSILWPEYKSSQWLKEEREKYVQQGLGDVYSQEYLNIPIDESNAYFRRSDFAPIRFEEREKKLNYYLSCDLAVTLKNSSDYTVFVVSGTDEDGKLFIKDVYRSRLDSLEIVDNILAMNKKYDFDFCVFEKGSITNTILPMLTLKMIEENNYITTHLINPSVDKVARAQSIRARMRSGAVKFDKEADWFSDLELELTRFPRDRHDDQVDAMSLLGLALDRFVEAPTTKEIQEDARDEEMRESGFFDIGRSMITGY